MEKRSHADKIRNENEPALPETKGRAKAKRPTKKPRAGSRVKSGQYARAPEETTKTTKLRAKGKRTAKPAIKKLEEELKTARTEAEELRGCWMRAAADFENYRKRTLREREDLLRTAGAAVLARFLEIGDDLERALESACTPDQFECFKEGLELVHRRFCTILQQEGVERIEDIGQEFDPNFHEAVLQVEDSEAESHTIIKVIQKGYKLGSKILRPSRVVVAK